MQTSLKLLKTLTSSKKAGIRRSKNKKLQLELMTANAFVSIFLPLTKIVKAWNKSLEMKEYLRPLFKNFGIYDRGLFLIEIFIQKEQSDGFGVFMTWNVVDARIAVDTYEILRRGEETMVGELINPKDSDEEMQRSLKMIASISEKQLLSRIVKEYPVETNKPQPLISKQPIDLTNANGSSPGDWRSACLELSDGYFNGSENLYSVLAEAENELLVDSQKVVVLGTDLRHPKDADVPVRCTREKVVTVRYLRKIFFDQHKVSFSLEWYKDHGDTNLAYAMIARNRAPIIIGSPV